MRLSIMPEGYSLRTRRGLVEELKSRLEGYINAYFGTNAYAKRYVEYQLYTDESSFGRNENKVIFKVVLYLKGSPTYFGVSVYSSETGNSDDSKAAAALLSSIMKVLMGYLPGNAGVSDVRGSESGDDYFFVSMASETKGIDHAKTYEQIVSLLKSYFRLGFNSGSEGSRRGYILSDGTFVTTEPNGSFNPEPIKYDSNLKADGPHYLVNEWLLDNGFISNSSKHHSDDGSPYLEDEHGAIRVNGDEEYYLALNRNAPTAAQYATIREILGYVIYKSSRDSVFSVNFPRCDNSATGITSTCLAWEGQGFMWVHSMKESHDNRGVEFQDEDYYIGKIKKYYLTGELPLPEALSEGWKGRPLGCLFGLRQSSAMQEGAVIHKTLNRALWTEDDELRPDVREQIGKIVDSFVGMLKENGVDLKVADIFILGSNASYNYNEGSDIDVHIIADTSGLGSDSGLLAALYNAYRTVFNGKHDIKLRGFPVELYVEDMGTSASSNGVYSLKDGWIRHPDREAIPQDTDVSKEFAPWEDRYIEVSGRKDIGEIERLIDGIYALRKKAIIQGGEYSKGNLVFKEFRKKGYLDDLRRMKTEIEDSELSLTETWENPIGDDEKAVRNALAGDNPQGSTFAILSAEIAGRDDNDSRTRKLASVLKKGSQKFVRCVGKYGMEDEKSFFVLNPSMAMKDLCTVDGLHQESYISGTSPSGKTPLSYQAYFWDGNSNSYKASPAGRFHTVTSYTDKASGFTEVGSLKFHLDDGMFVTEPEKLKAPDAAGKDKPGDEPQKAADADKGR